MNNIESHVEDVSKHNHNYVHIIIAVRLLNLKIIYSIIFWKEGIHVVWASALHIYYYTHSNGVSQGTNNLDVRWS